MTGDRRRRKRQRAGTLDTRKGFRQKSKERIAKRKLEQEKSQHGIQDGNAITTTNTVPSPRDIPTTNTMTTYQPATITAVVPPELSTEVESTMVTTTTTTTTTMIETPKNFPTNTTTTTTITKMDMGGAVSNAPPSPGKDLVKTSNPLKVKNPEEETVSPTTQKPVEGHPLSTCKPPVQLPILQQQLLQPLQQQLPPRPPPQQPQQLPQQNCHPRKPLMQQGERSPPQEQIPKPLSHHHRLRPRLRRLTEFEKNRLPRSAKISTLASEIVDRYVSSEHDKNLPVNVDIADIDSSSDISIDSGSVDDMDDGSWYDEEPDDEPFSGIFEPKNAAQVKARRMAIHYVYGCFYNFMPEEKWRRHKLVSKIAKHIHAAKGAHDSIRNTLRDILAHLAIGKEYTGARTRKFDEKNRKIPLDSYQATLVAAHVESGLSIEQTTHLLNLHRLEQGEEVVGVSCVYETVKRLKPMVSPVQVHGQGNYECDSAWAKARFNWVTQLLIRLGKLPQSEIDKLRDANGDLPTYFDKEKMDGIDIEQVLWWDETHKYQTCGFVGRMETRFMWNDAGQVCIENGKYNPPRARVKFKFPGQARLMLGVGIDTDGQGCRLPLYNYTGKTIVTIKEYELLIQKEIDRVRSLKQGGQWVEKKKAQTYTLLALMSGRYLV